MSFSPDLYYQYERTRPWTTPTVTLWREMFSCWILGVKCFITWWEPEQLCWSNRSVMSTAVYSSKSWPKGSNWAANPIFALPSVSSASSFGAGTPMLLWSPRNTDRNITLGDRIYSKALVCIIWMNMSKCRLGFVGKWRYVIKAPGLLSLGV